MKRIKISVYARRFNREYKAQLIMTFSDFEMNRNEMYLGTYIIYMHYCLL